MKKAAFITLGCRVNQYETQCIREELKSLGFAEGTLDEDCDLYLVNTCAVTGESVRKDKQIIRRILRKKEENPNALLCVCGCFPQGAESDPDLARADVLAGNTKKGELAALLASLCETEPEQRVRLDLREDISRPRPYEELSLTTSHNARAFVKIEDGCNSFCSYCYVPLVRGRVRSRGIDSVCREVSALCEGGYREIVLTGIETGAWGTDLSGGQDLGDLVEAVSAVEGVERIRFGSLKPTLFTEDFCARLAAMPKVLPHFHLSLQSGSSRVLALMGRRYDREREEDAIATLYRYFPDAGLSADLICGFPGEREEDFADTVSLVRAARLLHTHIFPFSPREGTRAATMPNPVPQEVKKERCAALLTVAKEESEAFARARQGKRYRVLCERVRDGVMLGYTENFIHTATPVKGLLTVGGIYPVTLGADLSFSTESMIVSAELDGNG